MYRLSRLVTNGMKAINNRIVLKEYDTFDKVYRKPDRTRASST